MRKFKSPYEISRLNATELLEYRQLLRNTLKVIKKEVAAMNKAWDDVCHELQFMEFRLSKDLKVAENKRKLAADENELNKLNVH